MYCRIRYKALCPSPSSTRGVKRFYTQEIEPAQPKFIYKGDIRQLAREILDDMPNWHPVESNYKEPLLAKMNKFTDIALSKNLTDEQLMQLFQTPEFYSTLPGGENKHK
jgi:hypothetical protein